MRLKTETEYKIIASVLLLGEQDREKIFNAADSEYFSDDTAKGIFRKLSQSFQRFPNADSSSYFTTLNQSELQAVSAAMNQMMSPAIAQEKLDDTLAAFRAAYIRRTLSADIAELSLNSNIQPNDIRTLADKAERLADNRKINSAEKYLEDYDKPVETVATGFGCLDSLLNGGFIKGTMSTIGARPSTGKTTFAINIAAHNPEKRCLFFSLEMSSRMIYDRLIADISNTDYTLSGLHQINFDTVKAVIKQYPHLSVADNVSDVEEMVSMIYSEKPELVIIDFVQIITSRKSFVDNRQRIDHISQMLKTAAKKTACCIVTLSQVTRAGKDKPTMSDLKESGGLEQDSDYVILLYREFVNNKSGNVTPEKTIVTLDKNKFGNTKELEYRFDGRHQRFTEVSDDSLSRPVTKEVTADDDLPF